MENEVVEELGEQLQLRRENILARRVDGSAAYVFKIRAREA